MTMQEGGTRRRRGEPKKCKTSGCGAMFLPGKTGWGDHCSRCQAALKEGKKPGPRERLPPGEGRVPVKSYLRPELKNKITPELLAKPDVLAVFLPTLRADFCLFETWSCPEEPPLDVPITALVADGDATVGAGDVEAWERYTTRAFTVRRFSGGHFFFRQQRDAVLDVLLAPLR